MNELLVNRLRIARTESGLKQQDVADKLGIKANTISNWEKGRTEPDIDTFVKLCEIYNIDCADLLSDVYAFKRISRDISLFEFEHIKKYRALDATGRAHVDAVMEWEGDRMKLLQERSANIISLESRINTPAKRRISYYYRNASAGTGELVLDPLPEKDLEIPDIPKYRDVSYAIGVNGDSMEPIYHDGDVLLVEATGELKIGDIGIFLVNNECYVKKMGETELISLNKDYDNIPLNESARIWGKVIDTYTPA